MLRQPGLPADPRCAGNAARVANRAWVDGLVAEAFAALPSGEVVDRLTQAQTAFGNVNSVHDLIAHPQLRTRPMSVGERVVEVPAPPWQVDWEPARFAPAPRVDEHGAAIRDEFAAASEDRVTAVRA